MFDFIKKRLSSILNDVYDIDVVLSECNELLIIRISNKKNKNACICINYVIKDKQLNFAIVSSNLNVDDFVLLNCLCKSVSKNMLSIKNFLYRIKAGDKDDINKNCK